MQRNARCDLSLLVLTLAGLAFAHTVHCSETDHVPPGSAQPPFMDFRSEAPGARHHITRADLPPPFASPSAGKGANLVERPAAVWPQAPAGFRVGLYADGLDMPRVLRTAPNGDVFVAESGSGVIRVFRGLNAKGQPDVSRVFASELERPYGLAFYPPGPHPEWIYVGVRNAVLRYPYSNGDLEHAGPAQRLIDLPSGGHWTRDLRFSNDGKVLYVAVGSASNSDDPDTSPAEHLRADILAFDADGRHRRVYASGIRNPAGLAVDPKSGVLWCSVNERDTLGDNLVPDYITSVREGGFYGWPWFYIGANEDPHHVGKHPELRTEVIVPDVLLQPHNASLQLLFLQGTQFPARYRGDLFAAEHGSWNRSVRTGYEVIRIHQPTAGAQGGSYEDFLTGFVLPNGDVWGRPVGLTEASDGSLLVSDDGSNSIWRVSFTGTSP